MSRAGYADPGWWRLRASVLNRGSVLSPLVLKYHWFQYGFRACKWVVLKISDFMRLYYCEARTSNAVELVMQDRDFQKNGLILKMFYCTYKSFSTGCKSTGGDKSHSKYEHAHLLRHQSDAPQCLDSTLLPGVTGCSATLYEWNLELTSMYAERLCSLSADYDSWDKLFSDLGQTQPLSWCCGGAVGEWLVWKSEW